MLLDFWYIGCGPCIKGFPKLQSIRDSFSENLISIHAINYSDKQENIEYFKSKHQFTFKIEDDKNNFTSFYGINSFPTLLLIDTTGAILFRIEGTQPQEFEKLLRLLKCRNEEFRITND